MNYNIHLPFREGCEDPLFKKSKWDKIDSLCSDDFYTLKYLRNRICARRFEWDLFRKDLVKLTIDENTTLDDIESRVNNLIYLLPHSYKVVSINKSVPKYNGDKLVGIDYEIELSISDSVRNNRSHIFPRRNKGNEFCPNKPRHLRRSNAVVQTN